MVIVSPLAGVVPVPNGQPLELSQRVACIPNSWHSLTLDRQSFHHQKQRMQVFNSFRCESVMKRKITLNFFFLKISLVVSTHLKNISQIESFPQLGMKTKMIETTT